MDAYSQLRDCSTLSFATIDYYQDAPSPLSSGNKSIKNICVSKSPGALQFVLNAKDHFGQKDFDFDIVFTGSSLGNDAKGNPRILWIPKLDFTKNKNSNKFYSSGFGISINSISGGITTSLVQLNPMQMLMDCYGNNALSEVTMNTLASDNNALQISAEVDLLGGIGKSISFNGISINGDSRALVSTFTELKEGLDNCGIGAGAGGVESFYAFVHDVPPGIKVRYAWDVIGGTITGPNGNYWCKVQLDNTGNKIEVGLRVEFVDINSQKVVWTENKTIHYTPETAKSVRRKGLFCKIRGEVIHNWFVNPLFDPLKDFSNNPITKDEIARMELFARNFLKDVENLKNAMVGTLETHD